MSDTSSDSADGIDLVLDPSRLEEHLYPEVIEDVGDALRNSSSYEVTSPHTDQNSPKSKSFPVLDHHKKDSTHSLGLINIGTGLKRVPSLMIGNANKIKTTLTESPNYDPFTKRSLLMNIVSMILNISDYGSDIAVAVVLRKEENTDWWFMLTVVLILVPLFLVNLFSIFWFHQDHNRKRLEVQKEGGFCPVRHRFSQKERAVIIISHALMIGPALRYVYIMFCGMKERAVRKKQDENKNKASSSSLNPASVAQGPFCVNPNSCPPDTINYYSVRKYYERDSAYLGLIEGFIQDGPQLVLQLYILAVRNHDDLSSVSVAIFQGVSVLLSLISLSWSMVSYIQASRWADPSKPQMTPVACIFNFLWRFFVVFSRVFTLSLFATVYQRELFVFLGLHWLFMSFWIFMMGTNFCGSAENRRRPLSELLYNIVMGFVCIFDFIHLKEGPTRYKHAFYYVITLAEGLLLMSIWYVETTKKNTELGNENYVTWSNEAWYQLTSMIVVPTFYIIGVIFMVVYYKFYHPEGPMPRKSQTASLF